MWLRTIGISFLKWLANYFVTILLIVYLLPSDWHGYFIVIPMWILSFIVALTFAFWLFHPRLPTSRDTAIVIVIWLAVSWSIQVFHAFYYFGTLAPLIYGPDMYVQYLLEILAILGMSYYMRRKKIQATLGEGLVD